MGLNCRWAGSHTSSDYQIISKPENEQVPIIELNTAGMVFIPCLFFRYDNDIAAVTLSVSGLRCPNIYVFSIISPS